MTVGGVGRGKHDLGDIISKSVRKVQPFLSLSLSLSLSFKYCDISVSPKLLVFLDSCIWQTL